MTLLDLLARARVVPDGVRGNADISGIAHDTRRDCAGKLFVCMPSPTGDSHRYLPAAKAAGAAAALVHSQAGFAAAAELPCVLVDNVGQRFNEALWRLCKVAFNDPSSKLRLIGVTGTNGKTTTAWLLRDMLASVGLRAGYLGTLGFQTPSGSRTLENTTPFSPEINELLAESVEEGVDAMAMEVSSHGLEQRRVDGLEFDAAVFTNFTQDHLDFHGDMAAYEKAKFRLFDELPAAGSKPFVAAINVDDPVGARWASAVRGDLVTFGQREGDLRGTPTDVALDRIAMTLRYGTAEVDFEAALGGTYNVENCLSAAAGFLALGYKLDHVAAALGRVRPVPGRFESVGNDRGVGVIVDYAHTPDAIEKLLDAVLALRHGRLIVVFGCGGDRDRNKRPKMARAVSDRADVSVVTSDNPRTEDAVSILDEVAAGIALGRESLRIVDRREAIEAAIGLAKSGDVVVIAGKGHENYQIVGRTKFPMDDREMARDALAAL